MSYIENNLLPGEKVIYTTRLHWSVLIAPFAVAFLVALPGVALLALDIPSLRDPQSRSIQTYAGIVFLLFAVGLLIRGLLIRNSTEMSVTTKRLVIKTGLLSRRTIELLLGKVESVQVLESFAGRMLGFGTIIVHGTGGTPESFHKIAHPLEFRRQMEQQLESHDK